MIRYKKFVNQASKYINFGDLEKTNGKAIIETSNYDYLKLPIVSAGRYEKKLSIYIDDNGNRAIIPPGWTVSGSSKENIIWGKDAGLVIYHIPKEQENNIQWDCIDKVKTLQKTYNQFVWIPVGLLNANGTLDGVSFTEKFGRRRYREGKFAESKSYEPFVKELDMQVKSVNKYGGFYISRYDISKKKNGNPQSVKGEKPWTNINYQDAKKVASTIEKSNIISSHLTFGAEYDSVLEWFIESGEKLRYEIEEDSTESGNYWNTKNSPKKVTRTGSREKWRINNIYDFIGNVDEHTQEQNDKQQRAIRGGNFQLYGNDFPASYHYFIDTDICYEYTGFRAVLNIK